MPIQITLPLAFTEEKCPFCYSTINCVVKMETERCYACYCCHISTGVMTIFWISNTQILYNIVLNDQKWNYDKAFNLQTAQISNILFCPLTLEEYNLSPDLTLSPTDFIKLDHLKILF